MRALFATILIAATLIGCQSGASDYERRAALVVTASALSIDMTRQAIADGTETSKQLAIKAIANRLQAMDIFAATDEPAEYAGTKARFMASDVGVVLTGDGTDKSVEAQEAALDRWTAIMIEYDMPFEVEE